MINRFRQATKWWQDRSLPVTAQLQRSRPGRVLVSSMNYGAAETLLAMGCIVWLWGDELWSGIARTPTRRCHQVVG